MSFLNQLVELLGRLGFNTTRLKWKLFQLEKRSQQKAFGVRLPASLQWLTYPHKRCRHCNGLVDRDERTCPHCGKRAPTMLGYRVTRLIGVAAPQGTPVMLGAFMLMIIAVYVLEIGMQGMSAIINPSNYTYAVFGAWTTGLRGELWRYLAFGLGHIGIFHIAFNLFALTQVGPPIEDRIGPWRMLVLITVTQIAAAIASYLYYFSYLQTTTATAGASGWLFGLIGYGIAYFGNQAGYVRDYRDQLVKWAVYSLVFGFVMGANNAAHVGGMIAGFAMGKIPEPRRHVAGYVNAAWKTAAAVCAALWILTLATLGHSIVTGWSPGGKPPSQIEAEHGEFEFNRSESDVFRDTSL
ncbi:MAG: rhomboid family intramembrane serine protease [Candidatus Hydrogenedentes bacterium]|nr:rhomboid family intramembrane serine protease [Candidatus Hydrogenedentota bacterium]